MSDARSAPIAIIGIGCLFPKAGHLGAYWSLLKNGDDAITPVPPTHWNPDDYFDADAKKPDMTYARRGGFLEPYPFAPGEFGIAPNDLESTDTAQLLGLVAAQMALRDAGYGPERGFDRSKVSVILGVTGTLELVVPLGARLGHPRWRRAMKEAGVPDAAIDDVVQRIGESYVGWQENSFPGLLGNVVAGRIANRLDLHGTNCVVDAACASSLSAMHLAGLELAAGRSDVVVTGGVDTFNDIFMYMCFSKTPALSPSGDAKPFSASADGTILGEGLGLVVLKRLADAERDGDRVYAVIRGLGSSSDGKGNAIYAPSADGQRRCLNEAYKQAGVSPATVELVEAHGTGTKVGDATEIKALTEVYEASRECERPDEFPWCALGSVKSQIGHTKAAAGGAGLIKAALALYHKVLPPTIKVDQPAESLASGATPFYVNTTKCPWLPSGEHPRRAAVSAFGFGGSNFHCVLEEHSPTKPAIDWDGNVQIAALCGDSANAIRSSLAEWETLEWDSLSRKAAESRSLYRPDAPFRLFCVFAKYGPPIAKVIAAARGLLSDSLNQSFAYSSDGAYLGRGPAAGKLGVLFPGQGSQYVGMLRDLACQFPAMLDVLVEANAVFGERPGADNRRLSDFIYPHPAFTADARAEQERALRATSVAQPAIGAVSLGAMRVLDGFGVRPDAAAGHSYGELTALCAAGCYDSAALHSLSRLRGQLMADVREGDPGSMLAVHAPLAQIEAALRDERLELVIANCNSPRQAVLSGATREIERATHALGGRNIRSTRLPVAAAFHSSLVADAERPFRQALEAIRFQATAIPVFANSSGDQYPLEPSEVRDLLGGQLARPVDFVREIENMVRAGVRTFIEVGPGSVLTRLVEATAKEITAGQPVDTFALDASGGKHSGVVDLAHLLARVAARGHAVRLSAWEADPPHPAPAPRTKSKTLIVPICGANFVKPKAVRHPSPPVSGGEGMGVTRKSMLRTGGDSPSRSITPLTGPANPPHTHPLSPAKPGERGDKPRVPAAKTPSPLTSPRIVNVSEPQRPPNSSALAQALQLTQEGLGVFQRLQEQTAQLHRQFLQSQETAQQTLTKLIEQQQQLLLASLGAAPLPVAPPIAVAPIPASEPLPSERRSLTPPSSAPSDGGDKPRRSPPTVAPPPSTNGSATHGNRSRVQQVLLEVIAEKTGYPAEMLDPAMGLDADLGIDSIKRVEILSALQERLPEAPAVKPEHLGTLNTLDQIIDFLAGGSAESPAPTAPATAGRERVRSVLLEVVAEKTGYPAEMLDPAMGLDADLGIDSIKRVEILSALQERLPEAPAVKPEHLGTLNTLDQIIDFLSSGTPPAATSTPTIEPNEAQPRGIRRQTLRSTPLPFEQDRPALKLAPGAAVVLVAAADALADHLAENLRRRGFDLRRVYWDSPVEVPPETTGLILLAPPKPSLELLAAGFRWLRFCGPALRKTGGAFLATVSRLDGAFGLDRPPTDDAALGGGLAGLAKTARHEWPEVTCKAIDVDGSLPAETLANELADELLRSEPAEVGINQAGRTTLTLVDDPSPSVESGLLRPDDVILISGGARGVTAEAALALAEMYRPTLVLLGRSPAPSQEPEWLRGLTDEFEIKRQLGARANGSATPREINRRFQELAFQREIRTNLERIAKAGARAVYRSVDVRDAAAVAAEIEQVRVEFGRITGLIHGAGVIEDRLIHDKTDEQFDRVVGTKVEGLLNVLAATQHDLLKVMALFSSSTGRFGRKGQVDYAVANEVLNKLARREAARRPECRVVAVNWGPWEGGMVTPGLRKLFEAEGVGLIPLRDGAKFLLAELSAPERPIEVVAGVWLDRTESAPPTDATMTSVWRREISVDTAPILAAHVIDGKAVVPLALHVEWLVHAALHGHPGLAFAGLNHVRVLSGIKLDPTAAASIEAVAGKARKEGGTLIVPVELRGRRDDGRAIAHSRAEVLLAAIGTPDPARITPSNLRPYARSVDDAYRTVLFHGVELRGIVSVDGITDDAITATVRAAPPPSAWLRDPPRQAWLADPLALDAAFQLMILWGVEKLGQPNLPAALGSYRQFRRAFPPGELRVAVRITAVSSPMIRADVEWLDVSGTLVARLENAEFVSDAKLAHAFRHNGLAASAVALSR
jgi:acyl transferase domain-containing protein/NAD(P)-dependent dehydrogenase (short-subunit alcohol dehydrogenase family)